MGTHKMFAIKIEGNILLASSKSTEKKNSKTDLKESEEAIDWIHMTSYVCNYIELCHIWEAANQSATQDLAISYVTRNFNTVFIRNRPLALTQSQVNDSSEPVQKVLPGICKNVNVNCGYIKDDLFLLIDSRLLTFQEDLRSADLRKICRIYFF
jgi:hypothetical protein